jgi:hypothetical protein
MKHGILGCETLLPRKSARLTVYDRIRPGRTTMKSRRAAIVTVNVDDIHSDSDLTLHLARCHKRT